MKEKIIDAAFIMKLVYRSKEFIEFIIKFNLKHVYEAVVDWSNPVMYSFVSIKETFDVHLCLPGWAEFLELVHCLWMRFVEYIIPA